MNRGKARRKVCDCDCCRYSAIKFRAVIDGHREISDIMDTLWTALETSRDDVEELIGDVVREMQKEGL